MEIKYKKCTKCGEEKEVSEFHKMKGCKYGVRNTCKNCMKEYQKEYRKENADRLKECQKEYQKEYQKENADRLKEYRKENADRLKEYRKEYRKENADRLKEYQKEYRKEYQKEYQISLSDGYIITQLRNRNPNLTTEQIRANPELIRLKRLAIQYYREHLKEIKK